MNVEEIVLLLVLAVVVIGPHRLPTYAEQLARLVRSLRDMARGATQTIKEELGPEAADLDFSQLDPRQYDPRRIVREALAEDVGSTNGSSGSRSSSGSGSTTGRAAAGGASAGASNSSAAAPAASATATVTDEESSDDSAVEELEDPLAHGAPFDTEAT